MAVISVVLHTLEPRFGVLAHSLQTFVSEQDCTRQARLPLKRRIVAARTSNRKWFSAVPARCDFPGEVRLCGRLIRAVWLPHVPKSFTEGSVAGNGGCSLLCCIEHALTPHVRFCCKQVAIGDDGRMQPFVPVEALFKGRHFDGQVIILCVSWYTSFKLSLRDLVIMMADRGIALTHTTILKL